MVVVSYQPPDCQKVMEKFYWEYERVWELPLASYHDIDEQPSHDLHYIK